MEDIILYRVFLSAFLHGVLAVCLSVCLSVCVPDVEKSALLDNVVGDERCEYVVTGKSHQPRKTTHV